MSDLLLRPDLMRMKDDAGNVVFSTENANLVTVGKLIGTIDIGGHTPDTGLSTFHEIDHEVGVANSADGVIAWGRIILGTGYIPANRPFCFSESVVLDGIAFKKSGYAQIISTLVFLSVVLTAGRVNIRESYINLSNPSAPTFTSPPLPTYSVQYDIRAIRWVGGF